jgi:hypothetical protein
MKEQLKSILNEDQDPRAIEKITAKLSNLLMSNEEIGYIGVQKKPAITVFPDSIVMTNKRIIMCTPKNFGLSMDFVDYDWDDISSTFVKENILGSQFSFSTKTELVIDIDYIPKNQARKLYTYAKEQMEIIRSAAFTGQSTTALQPEDTDVEEVETEEVVNYAQIIPAQDENFIRYEAPSEIKNETITSKPSQDELFAKLQNYKKLLDNGLILQGEYDTFKKDILSQM